MRRTASLLALVGVATLLASGVASVWAFDPGGLSVAKAETPYSIVARFAKSGTPRPVQPEASSGVFNVVWGDPRPRLGLEPTVDYVLTNARGRSTELLLKQGLTKPLGGPQALDGKRVEVVGTSEAGDRIQVESIELAQSEETARDSATASAGAVSGSHPTVTILCRFGDVTEVTPHEPAWFETLMGSSEPGMDHYWREVSYGRINLTGSRVVGWYNLPLPRSSYTESRWIDLHKLASDCAAAADADVFFPNFTNINFMFNQDLDCCAYGLAHEVLTLDGQTKQYRAAWIPPWSYQHQHHVAHEMGHTFGLPHSSGPYSATYDSKWDVMSSGGTCSPKHAQYGCVAVHPISYHKELLGWIPPEREYTATLGANPSITIEQLGMPASVTDYLMAKIPIGGSDARFYTVEARRFAGYDVRIPGEGIIIHKVDTSLPDRQAQVVDIDEDDDPNDEGAIWLPGETFTDPTNGISVQVSGKTAGGYTVRIDGGVDSVAPTVSYVTPAAQAKDVPVGTNVQATFSEAMDAQTIDGTTFTLTKQGSITPIPVTVSYDAQARKATLNPDADLEAGATYAAIIKGGSGGVKDLAGNPLAADEAWSFTTVDTTPPETTIDSGPSGAVNSGSASFEFSASEAGSTFECRLDGVSFGSCSSPKAYAGLADGSHAFEVRAIDAAGNADPSPALRKFTVDTAAPAPPVITEPAEGSRNNTGSFAVIGTAEPGSRVSLLQGTTLKGLTKADGSGNWSVSLTGVAEGWHVYTAKATDAAGNTSDLSATRTVIVDTAKPTVLNVFPVEGATGVDVAADVNATFSEEMDPSTINGDTFKLVKLNADGTRTVVSATVSYDFLTKTAILDPEANLRHDRTYKAKLATSVRDLAGNSLDSGTLRNWVKVCKFTVGS